MKTLESSQYQVADTIAPGVLGRVAVSRFEVTREGAFFASLREGRRAPYPGTYTALHVGGSLWMSDTPAEIRDHWTLFRNARGRVLVHGLGLGMAVRGLLLDSEVEHVLVIEKDPDVIAYIAPQLEARFGTARWTVRQDDALTWKPEKGARWDVVWHDIWPSITSDNLDSMATLHRRFGARCDWQGSWAREECKDRARREKKHGGWW